MTIRLATIACLILAAVSTPSALRGQPVSPSASNSIWHPPLEGWLDAAPAMRSGLLDFVAHRTQATRVNVYDCILTQREAGRCNLGWGLPFKYFKPTTQFVAGEAGPQRYSVVYDPHTRAVLVLRGCCATEETILIDGVGPPPRPVASADLSAIHTAEGFHFGSTMADVARVFGPARTLIVAKRYPFVALRYEQIRKTHSSCVRDATFLFTDDRLVALSFANLC